MIKAFFLAAAAAMVLAAPAHADSAADDRFLSMLENAGMSGGDRAVIINNGHVVCGNLWSGVESFEDQVAQLRQVETLLTEGDARAFVAIAIQAYCPDISARRKVTP